jgi:hypothetical protein
MRTGLTAAPVRTPSWCRVIGWGGPLARRAPVLARGSSDRLGTSCNARCRPIGSLLYLRVWHLVLKLIFWSSFKIT